MIRAVKQFMGRRKIREAYSDMAPQLIASMKALKIPMDHSLAGKTKHNSLAERSNQFLLVATTTCLLEAGIPPCLWRYAIWCVSHLLNIEPNDQEVSAWCKLHGEEFRSGPWYTLSRVGREMWSRNTSLTQCESRESSRDTT